MPRLFVKGNIKWRLTIMSSFILSMVTYGQTFEQCVDFADEKMLEGDYYYAIQYYKKAMAVDSNSVEVNWKMAEAQRLYKDYQKAAYYYKKVFAKENGLIYPKSIFWLATMETYNGDYEAALEHWKLAKKTFKKERKSYPYKKAQQGIKSCLWAMKAIRDTSDFMVQPLPLPVNTPDAELAPNFWQNRLVFTSLKADSINGNEQVFSEEYSLQIYTAKQEDSIFSNVQPLKGTKQKGMNSANGSVSPDGKRFYFSRCDPNFNCKIFVGEIKGDRIVNVDSLGEIINEPGAITTMPHSTQIDGQEYLFFVSNRAKTIGGLDIWYSVVSQNGNKYSKARNLGRGVNTLDDDISPFYDTLNQQLYFSSSWHEGFGGQDIFVAKNEDMRFLTAVNLGLPINSSQNDTYFIIDQKQDRFYYSSNRVGVNYAKNPTCCNDLFSAYLPKLEPPTRFESLTDLNKKLPVTLYFHNDEPDPRTRDTTTDLTYMESYDAYVEMEDRYKKEYAKGLNGDAAEEAREDIDDFFTQYVEQGVIDLEEFLRLLKQELAKGYAIEVTVRGFASPLAQTDYNVNLTKRRINSLINFLYEYEEGVFAPYLDQNADNGGALTFVQIPFGEYSADALISDNINDQKNSVYSRKAALERKIEIQSVSFARTDTAYAKLFFPRQIHDFGSVQAGTLLSHDFLFTNTGDQTLQIDSLVNECECLIANLDKKVLEPGESGKLSVSLNTTDLKGLNVKHIKVYANIENKLKEVTITTEVDRRE